MGLLQQQRQFSLMEYVKTTQKEHFEWKLDTIAIKSAFPNIYD